MPARLLQLSRKVHLYFGVFISPALVFFAFTGALQTLGLHEAAGNSYKPPAVLATLGQIHKKQTWMLPQRRPLPQATPTDGAPLARAQRGFDAASAATPGRPSTPGRPNTLTGKLKEHLPLKIFFVLVSVGLLTSTVTGIYMAYKYERRKVLVTLLLVVGTVIPLVLLPL